MKILLLIAGVGLVIFLFITSIAPFRNGFLSALYPKSASNAAGGASISLLPGVTANVGQTFTTPVMIDTAGGDIVGVDVQLNFDKTALELTDVTFYPENHDLKDYVPDLNNPMGKPLYLSLTNSTGVIQFSALSGPETVFNGQLNQSNPFALLQFKVLKNTPTSVTFIHTPDSTVDTNLTSPANPEPIDLLKIVTNMYVNDPSPPITYPEISPNPSPKPGDIDKDNDIDIFDYSQLLTDFAKTGSNLVSDLDKDGKVGIFDYNILLTNFGK